MIQIKVDEEDYIDKEDALDIAQDYLVLTRCVSGRLIVKDLICPHCRSSNPSGKCLGKSMEQKVEDLKKESYDNIQ